MSFLMRKFDEVNRKVSVWLERIGLGALLFMMCLTCVDVAGTKLFRISVLGSIDMVMIAQLIAMTFAAPMALLLGRHIRVDFFLGILPRRLRFISACAVCLLGFAIFAIISWRLIVYGHSLQAAGEESATARIPLYPFAYGAGVVSIIMCLIYLQRFFELFEGENHEL